MQPDIAFGQQTHIPGWSECESRTIGNVVVHGAKTNPVDMKWRTVMFKEILAA